MHSDCTGYGLYLEAWSSRHSGAVSGREQVQEGDLTAVHWRGKTMLFNGKKPSGRFAGSSVSKFWTTTPPRELCGRNMSKNKLVDIKP